MLMPMVVASGRPTAEKRPATADKLATHDSETMRKAQASPCLRASRGVQQGNPTGVSRVKFGALDIEERRVGYCTPRHRNAAERHGCACSGWMLARRRCTTEMAPFHYKAKKKIVLRNAIGLQRKNTDHWSLESPAAQLSPPQCA